MFSPLPLLHFQFFFALAFRFCPRTIRSEELSSQEKLWRCVPLSWTVSTPKKFGGGSSSHTGKEITQCKENRDHDAPWLRKKSGNNSCWRRETIILHLPGRTPVLKATWSLTAGWGNHLPKKVFIQMEKWQEIDLQKWNWKFHENPETAIPAAPKKSTNFYKHLIYSRGVES